MVWSPKYAANAYLDTVKLVKNTLERKKSDPSLLPPQPEKNEFISALAAGTSSQLIVEVSPEDSNSTIALAAAARQTGGRLVCILPEEESLASSKEVIEECGLNDMVEFRVGNPMELLPKYENIDFSLVDCNQECYKELLRLIDMNLTKSVVVANNLKDGGEGLCIRGPNGLCGKGEDVRMEKHLIGDGMEVTMIGKNAGLNNWTGMSRGVSGNGDGETKRRKSRWVKRIDEQSGEEHIYRLAAYV